MYKQKYLKYKRKYLNLIGGLRLFNSMTRDEFLNYYLSNDKSSYEKILTIEHLNKVNILVGCGNFNDNDYLRFRCSPYYSLYIETIENFEGVSNSRELDPNKQYDMYTIFIEEIDKKKLFPENFIDNIHLDLNVSNFCKKDDYLNLVRKSLKIGGKFVFQELDKGAIVYLVNEDNKIIDTQTNKEIYITEFNINHDSKRIDIPNENIEKFFDSRVSLSPSVGIALYKKMTKYKPDLNIREKYKKYLKTKLPGFDVQLKMCTYENYDYPVPFRVNGNLDFDIVNCKNLNYLVNFVMTIDEKMEYYNTGKLKKEKLPELSQRISEQESEYLNSYKKEFDVDYNHRSFFRSLLEEIYIPIYYYEITRIE